jgi:hypothetical protein
MKTKEHLDERTIELYVIKSESLRGRRSEVKAHLNKCPGCNALYREAVGYYREAEKLKAGRSHEVGEGLTIFQHEHFLTPEPPRRPLGRVNQSFLVTFKESVRLYPMRWSVGFAALVLALALVIPKIGGGASVPSYARAKEEFLITYNAEGAELWRKHIGEGYDVKRMPDWLAGHPDRALTAVDVDGDGTNEVLAIFGWIMVSDKEIPGKNSIICYNADGTQRWQYEVHRDMTIGGVHYADDYRISLMLVDDFDRDGKMDVILQATHHPWFPNVLIRLSAIDGSFVGEYWHPGAVPYFAQQDLDGDGVRELLFAGQNNRFGRACLLVLDPRTIEGYAPSPPEFIPEGISRGKERYYVLFPSTELEPLWADVTNHALNLTIRTDSTIEAVVLEPLWDQRPTLYYYFDLSMKCVSVRGSDFFTGIYRQYQHEGKIQKPLDDAFYDRLRNSVRYWNGTSFVMEPTPVAR